MADYLVQRYLDASCRAGSSSIALIDERGAMTYEDLYTASNRLANCLKGRGVQRQDRVAILLGRSAHAVVAMLGVLKADAIYVPIDVKSPVSRWKKILDDCQPAAILCGAAQRGEVDDLRKESGSVRAVVVFGTQEGVPDGAEASVIPWGEAARVSDVEPGYRNIDIDIAYIMYTSGSTGRPKGVAVTHLNVLNYIDWAVECFGIGRQDRILGTAPFHFDMSTFDVYAALKAGAALCIAPERVLLFPARLLDLMEKEGITVWKGVSSLFAYLSSTGALKKDRIPALRAALFGGEVLPTKHLIRWMETYPGKKFYNVYGPTEATGISTYYALESIPGSPREAVPIGTACANTEVVLLTENGDPAPPGTIGELCIRGSGVSAGYWNDDEKTKKAFAANPLNKVLHDRIYRTGDLARLRPDGNLEYVGRRDFQVKYMGYRIELYEIEKALVSLDGITNAAVLLCDSGLDGIQELVAFVESPIKIDAPATLEALKALVPPYMVPKKIFRLDRILVNGRGKTDRDALLAHYRSALQGA